MFYQGSLQDGIALAVREAKAVVCFVREDTETCLQWETDYFGDEELAQSLEAKAIVLRLTAGTQEAGFLVSFCPISEFPTVIVIKNGSLREYLVPEISKDHFRRQIIAAVDDHRVSSQDPNRLDLTPQPRDGPITSTAITPAPSTARTSASRDLREHDLPRMERQLEQQQGLDITTEESHVEGTKDPERNSIRDSLRPAEGIRPRREEGTEVLNRASSGKTKTTQERVTLRAASDAKKTSRASGEASKQQLKAVPLRLDRYRLQVRLFDGRSVRSSFTPSQTIRKDVRSWLDGQQSLGAKPYNLMHILTPLPNHTLSISEEDKTLEELGLGSSANLVMVPVQSFTEAYSLSSSSLPTRAVSSAINLGYSAASAVGSLIGSYIGYGQASTSTGDPPTEPPDESHRRQPPVNRSPIIRTLRDQQEDRGGTQFYNGNQLNFQPRKDRDGE